MTRAPPNRWVWHKNLLRRARTKNYSPDTLGTSKNASDFVSIFLRRSASGARQKTEPLQEGWESGRTVPWGFKDKFVLAAWYEWYEGLLNHQSREPRRQISLQDAAPNQVRAILATAGRSVKDMYECWIVILSFNWMQTFLRIIEDIVVYWVLKLLVTWNHITVYTGSLAWWVEFTNGPGDLGSIPSRVIPKTLKMVRDTSLLNAQQYKVRIKSKVMQSRERSRALPLLLGVVAIEKGAFWSLLTTVSNYVTLQIND